MIGRLVIALMMIIVAVATIHIVYVAQAPFVAGMFVGAVVCLLLTALTCVLFSEV